VLLASFIPASKYTNEDDTDGITFVNHISVINLKYPII